MSFKARRLTDPGNVVSFLWDGLGRTSSPQVPLIPGKGNDEASPGPQAAQLATIERDAYAKGFEAGEKAGIEVAGVPAQALVQRLTRTLEELGDARAQMVRQTERQMVELALAIARRIIHREVQLDRDLLIAMARVALDRLGDSAQVTVHLHPDEYEATGMSKVTDIMGRSVSVVADPRLERGGCLVESDMGSLDVGVDAQIEEVARALLGTSYREPIRNAA